MEGSSTNTYITIMWHLGKKGALRTAIDFQEDKVTLLQEKETQSKWLIKTESYTCPGGRHHSNPHSRSFSNLVSLGYRLRMAELVLMPVVYALVAAWWSVSWRSRLPLVLFFWLQTCLCSSRGKEKVWGSQGLTNCSWGTMRLCSTSDSGWLCWLPKDCILQKMQLHGVLKGWTWSEQQASLDSSHSSMPATVLSGMADSLIWGRGSQALRDPCGILSCQCSHQGCGRSQSLGKWDLWWVQGSTFSNRGFWEHREARLSGLYTVKWIPQVLGTLDLNWSITTWWNVGSSHVSFFHE